MNNYERIMSMEIDELAEYLNDKWTHDDDPSIEWWNKKYCSNCEPITVKAQYLGHNIDCSWCELNDDKCKYFPELKEMPDSKQIMRMWLESDVE